MIEMIRKILRDDKGLTLPELLIVTVLLTFVLVVIWNINTLVNHSYDSNKERSDSVYNSSAPLWIMDKFIGQNISIERFEPYNLTILMDSNADSVVERAYFTYSYSKKSLEYAVWTTNSARQDSVVLRAGTLATDLYNPYYGRPIFTYYDFEGNQITDTNKIQSDTRSVQVNFLIRNSKNYHIYENSRDIYFRNRGL